MHLTFSEEKDMKNLTNHKVDSDGPIEIDVLDEPGHGGACHRYLITDAFGHQPEGEPQSGRVNCLIEFQDGPINEVGINGISNESLLAIVEHRLLGFQSGPYSCRENAIALTKIQEAMHWLQHRTNDRLNRNVEGTSES